MHPFRGCLLEGGPFFIPIDSKAWTSREMEEVEFVTSPPPRGLGTTIGKLEVWIREDAPELLAAIKDSKIPGLAKNGTNQYSSSGLDNIKPSGYGGTNSTYLTARLKRDLGVHIQLYEHFIDSTHSPAGWTEIVEFPVECTGCFYEELPLLD